MANWLEQAREGNALLGEVRVSAGVRAGIGERIEARRTRRRLGVGVGAVVVMVVVASAATTKTTTTRPSASATAITSASTSASASASASATTETRTRTTEVRFEDGSRAVIEADARLAIERDDEKEARAVLSAGTVRFEVEPRGEAPFVVQAGAVSVRVVGTRFSVTRSAALVEVAVEVGEVEVVVGSEAKRLRAGEHGSFSAAPIEPARAERSRPEKRDATGELLAAADLARREGRASDAIAALQTLLERHGRDPRAPSAAFSLGRVLLETQQRPREAAAAFARVAKLDAKSPLVEDALAREIEAWAQAGERARSQALARAYLARFPDGPRAAFVRKHAQLE